MAKNSVNRSKEYEELYRILGAQPETRLFETMKDVFLVALALGFRDDYRKPLKANAQDGIRLDYFTDEQKSMMDLIAFAAKGDINILIEQDEIIAEKYQLIEEYANGGMQILNEQLRPIPSYDALKELVELFYEADDWSGKVDITGISV